MAAWDRQEKEPPKAYQHFTVYRDLGPDRTLGKVSSLANVTEGTLLQLSHRHNWTARCDQWDAHLEAIHQRAMLTEVAKRGRQRAQAFTALLGKALEGLKHVDPEKVTLGEVTKAMTAAATGLRLEEDLATAHVTMEVQDARVILSRLPAEVRSGLLRALGAELEGRRSGGAPLGIRAGTPGDDA